MEDGCAEWEGGRTVVGVETGMIEQVSGEALVSSGLWDGVDEVRRKLCEMLLARGCTIAEMVEANERGRLYGLAGDRRLRPGTGRVKPSEAASQLGMNEDAIGRAWAALGVGGAEDAGLTPEDLAALELVRDATALLGEEGVLGLLRVAGAGLARLAEAEASIARGDAQLDLGRTSSELVTAEAWELTAELAGRIGVVLDAAHRHHLEASRVLFESFPPVSEAESGIHCGVGFADISGFTSWSASVGMEELSEVLRVFEAEARSIISSRGGRVVKQLGDAVMWVHPNPQGLAEIAWELTRACTGDTGLEVRAGIAHGQMLVQDGDYFGVPVNLAARLVGLAAPGEVRVPCALEDRLPDWVLEDGAAHEVRGFHEPVECARLQAKPVV